jgi:hypothetical protein
VNKIIEAEDILAEARSCIECVWMAAADLSSNEEVDPIQVVTHVASDKIAKAIALLEEYRADIGAGPQIGAELEPEPDAPDASQPFGMPLSRRPQ